MTTSNERDGVVLSDVSHRYDTVTVLHEVSASFPRGVVTALVGENGAGKSTLLKVLGGSIRPNSGEVRLGGSTVDLEHNSPAKAQRVGIAIVHQEQALAEPLTVAENIFLGHEFGSRMRLDRAAARSRAKELLARLGSDLDPSTLVSDLSLAQRQLVEIAKALSFDAALVALDEPSAVLGGAELQNLFQVVRRLAADGVSVVYVSHRMDEIFDLCDQYLVLRDGRVAGRGAVAEVSRDELVHLMVGRPVNAVFPESKVDPGPVRLEVERLTVTGKVFDASFRVHAGEIVGVAGLAGAGRSTLVKAIFGAIPAAGQISVDGFPIAPVTSPRAAIRAGIAYLPEDRKHDALALAKPVRWNVSIAALDKVTSRFGSTNRGAERRLTTAVAEQLNVKLARQGEEPAGSLSGGNQQKVVLGRWLQRKPGVLILDEPTRGVDVGAKEQIYRELRSLTEQGMAVLIVSSELIEVLGLSDRVLVMAGGRLVGELSRAAASESAVMSLITDAAGAHVTEVG